jgi:hypothetical protein
MLYREFEPAAIEKAIEVALKAGVSTSQAIKHLLKPSDPEQEPEKLKQWGSFEPADISVYSKLGGVS